MKPAENPFPVVGVGASAGGLNPITQLLAALPARPGLALVIIQHLDPHHESQLAALLKPHTSMTVVEATHGMKVEPDHVYVIQPNTSVAIADGVLSVTARPDDRRPHYPVDHFFRSLAAVQGAHAVGVILSGTGSDGTLGAYQIKAVGGLTFAQDEESAQHAGMPQHAVASGSVDLALPPVEIAARLASLPQHPYLVASTAAQPHKPDDAASFQRVITALRTTSGVDFSQYRDTTIKRRAARRMLLRGFKSATDYAAFVERDRDEAAALYRDVLINVTSFFRDAEAFEDLKRDVFPAIVDHKSDGLPVRVWVPGCSTGQEAYSIAMVLLEFLDTVPSRRPVQIFATDLGDPAALDRARAGVYPESIEAEVSPERLRRFFTKEERSYRIQKQVRDLCVFARQNVTVDPPFSRVDMITCRNVLIYMSQPLQERLLPVFHFALNPAGFLVLGAAETVGPFGDLFELVNRQHKIYRKKDAVVRPPLTFLTDDWLGGGNGTRVGNTRQPPADFQREADRLALARYGPPSVLVNRDLEVQQFRGRTAPFLEAPAGQPTMSILRMAKEGLFMELRSALAEAQSTGSPVVREHLKVIDRGAPLEFTLRILPVTIAQHPDSYLLVLFESADWPVLSGAAHVQDDLTAHAGRDVAWLRQELSSSKQYLQSLVDQHEASAQELRAAHEEVLSSNEELQSTNEELETTKEELQSANEELTTVNEQFLNRNRELDTLTDDLSNFISSADLPMVTVGRDLRVRRLTPAAQRAFNLLPSDIGRSLEHIKFSLAIDHIADVIDRVITTVQPWEREVKDRDGRWWVVRVHPFRTADNRIDGATIVAVDIDLVRRSHEVIEARDYALAIIQAVREPLVVLDSECRVGLANEAFYTLFGLTPGATTDKPLWDVSPDVWQDSELRQALLDSCAGTHTLRDFEVESVLPRIGRRLLVLNARNIVRAGRPDLLLLAIEDVTDTRAADALRIDAETLRLLDKRKDEFLGILAHELRNPLAPIRFALELLRGANGEPAVTAKASQVLERQIGHMVRIVDDLLDVSRITLGKVELRKERLALSEVVNAAVELCRPAIVAAGHALTVSLPDEPIILDGDAVRLTQVLSNLLNNAVKFTPGGGHIWLIVDVMEEMGQMTDYVRIRVRDTGIGISREALPTIFDMFMQGDRSLERTRTGLGVGLTLVRNLVALHGGTVMAKSDGLGSGSEFTIRLPIDRSAQPARVDAPLATEGTANPLRILIADDNADGRDMLRTLLEVDGHAVATAVDGPSAVATARSFHPHAALLDIGMPGMNGYDAARALRQQPGGADMVLAAISGMGQHEDKARAIEAGFDRHFTKPVDITTLRAFLAAIGTKDSGR